MRGARIVEDGAAYYHVMSRVVGREFVFHEDMERERFRKTMRAVEGFCGVRIVTYACLSNHWHILVHVPERQAVGDAEFVRRLRHLYDLTVVENLGIRGGGVPAAPGALQRAAYCAIRSAGGGGDAALSDADYRRRKNELNRHRTNVVASVNGSDSEPVPLVGGGQQRTSWGSTSKCVSREKSIKSCWTARAAIQMS